MRKKIPHVWEQMDAASWRTRVIGGWLVLHCNSISIIDGKKRSTAQSESMVFVGDKDHEWIVLPAEPTP